ncbi:hypothetical protein RSSM_06844 [Rhodopirellula sallentina SM41]|uniref:Uncharacterized protein n=1 Tax=Rhodopirellula sallentina SM41 TaxID=1263870 RepID=M5TRB2_9BACT|nr:hypothetical protein RSSM_06844 [Rhodopirellula sallentina SM41]
MEGGLSVIDDWLRGAFLLLCARRKDRLEVIGVFLFGAAVMLGE